MDTSERNKIVQMLFDSMKTCIVCSEGEQSCRLICSEHAELCNTCIKLIMKNTPNWDKALKLCLEVGKTCVDSCKRHEYAHCKECVLTCGKLVEYIGPYCS